MHVHDPPQDHVITIRSGRMRWTVEGESFDAGPGDVIVTPAGTPHSYEVLGVDPAGGVRRLTGAPEVRLTLASVLAGLE
jgi:quercetin dioxygenase-like cupin family protein